MREEHKLITELSKENSELRDKIQKSIRMCDEFNFWDKTSMRFALGNIKKFLKSDEKVNDKA